jgi:ATP-dependent RNA helicase SUPV3L1/SUV3
VIVIDEIQMIEDRERGFAWTRALMGLRCKEVHCCGGLEAVTLIQKIANACNDDFEVKRYERFSKLTVAETSLASSAEQGGSYKWVRFQKRKIA